MAVTSHVFTKFADALANKEVDISGTLDTIKAMLLTAYTPAQDTHKYVSAVLAAGTESGTTGGYTTGGVTLASTTWTTSGHVYTLDAADKTIGTGDNAAYVVFFDATPGTDATNPVICYWDLGGTVSVTALQFDAAGILTLTGS